MLSNVVGEKEWVGLWCPKMQQGAFDGGQHHWERECLGGLGPPVLVGLNSSHGNAPFGVVVNFPWSVEWFCADSRHWVGQLGIDRGSKALLLESEEMV
jgi:hypothetical protein